MKKLNPPRLVTVAVFTTVTIIFWIFFSVYNILTTEAEVDIDQNLLKPIDPTLNTEVLNRLPQRQYFEPGSTQNLNIIDSDQAPPEQEAQEAVEPTTTPAQEEEQEEQSEEQTIELETGTTPVPSPTSTL